jgi:hypothetical protein
LPLKQKVRVGGLLAVTRATVTCPGTPGQRGSGLPLRDLSGRPGAPHRAAQPEATGQVF